MVQEEFGFDRFVHFEYHIAHEFATDESIARSNWYGIPGAPTVRIDGSSQVVGATTCDETSSTYRDLIQARLDETAGLTPIEIVGSFVPLTYGINANVTFRLVDPASLTNLRATILLYEDDVLWDGELWQHVVRKIHDENITLVEAGDVVLVTLDQPADPSWSLENLHAVAYLQQTSGSKPILQGALLPYGDFDLAPLERIASIPDGSGEAIFHGEWTNQSDDTDLFVLQMLETPGDWATEFFLCGSSNPNSDPTEILLEAGESCSYEIHVATDAAMEIRSGLFSVSSGTSGRSMTHPIRLFNGSPSILLVDDDGTGDQEVALRDALDANGVLHDSWDVIYEQAEAAPGTSDLEGYDVVIWQTGYDLSTYVLDRFDRAALTGYLGAGGALFLTSQNFLNGIDDAADPFVVNGLGVESWVLETSYDRLDGQPGDPIGDGLILDLDFTIPFFNQGDDAVPTATAETSFLAPDGSHGMIRNEPPDGGRTVFMPAAFHAIADNAPWPNMRDVVLGRILDWLRAEDPAAMGETGAGRLVSQFRFVRPNPFSVGAEIAFTLSPRAATGRVVLDLFDPAGRRIATLLDGSLPPGPNSVRWDPIGGGGDAPGSGIYFVRLTTVEGTTGGKLLRIGD